ncbi:MAG: 50S ribosomal protein L23 [Bacteroidales bacterium]|nr:50S ribosomal protein L23 [Bacteroidales bacterium]
MAVIIRPVISEKMSAKSEKMNRFGFIVHREANKIEIKKAVEQLYNVRVKEVNTARYTGKNKSRFTKQGLIKGRTENYKKAIITLYQGETIDLYSNI